MTVPEAPAGLTGVYTAGKMALTWEATEGAESYKVYRNTTGAPVETLLASVATEAYDDESIVAGTTYYYVVTAINEDGESDPSSAIRSPLWIAPNRHGLVSLPGNSVFRTRGGLVIKQLAWNDTAAAGSITASLKNVDSAGDTLWSIVAPATQTHANDVLRIECCTDLYYSDNSAGGTTLALYFERNPNNG